MASEPIGEVARLVERRESAVANLSPMAKHRLFPKIYPMPVINAPPVVTETTKAIIEENKLLRAENIRLRAKLAAKMGIAAVGAPTMESVIACYLRILGESGYTAETGPITLADLQCGRRSRAYARPRHVAMWCVRRICRYASLPMIAQKFAKADHTVVKHGCTRIEKVLGAEPFWMGIATQTLAAFGEKP